MPARIRKQRNQTVRIYFSDFFGVSEQTLEKFGAFNISLLADFLRLKDNKEFWSFVEDLSQQLSTAHQ